MTLEEALFVVFTFFLGAIPFSLILGRIALKEDIREYGDGNPGTFNVIRAGGIGWGALAMVLDLCKSAVPVGLAAHIFAIDGIALILICVAAPLGHAFSPFLGFKGGKAVAATGGTFIGLTLMEVFIVGIVMLVYWYMAVTISGWAVILASLSMGVYMLLTAKPTLWFIVWAILMGLMIYKHRHDLRKPPRLKLSPLFRPFFKSVRFTDDALQSADSVHPSSPDGH